MICNLGLGPVVARSDARFLLPVLTAATIPWGVVQLRSAHAIASEDLRDHHNTSCSRLTDADLLLRRYAP